MVPQKCLGLDVSWSPLSFSYSDLNITIVRTWDVYALLYSLTCAHRAAMRDEIMQLRPEKTFFKYLAQPPRRLNAFSHLFFKIMY